MEEAHVRLDSEISLKEGLEVGQDGVAVGADIVGLEPIEFQHFQEKLGWRKR